MIWYQLVLNPFEERKGQILRIKHICFSTRKSLLIITFTAMENLVFLVTWYNLRSGQLQMVSVDFVMSIQNLASLSILYITVYLFIYFFTILITRGLHNLITLLKKALADNTSRKITEIWWFLIFFCKYFSFVREIYVWYLAWLCKTKTINIIW